jgi:hypothetical protein
MTHCVEMPAVEFSRLLGDEWRGKYSRDSLIGNMKVRPACPSIDRDDRSSLNGKQFLENSSLGALSESAVNRQCGTAEALGQGRGTS